MRFLTFTTLIATITVIGSVLPVSAQISPNYSTAENYGESHRVRHQVKEIVKNSQRKKDFTQLKKVNKGKFKYERVRESCVRRPGYYKKK